MLGAGRQQIRGGNRVVVRVIWLLMIALSCFVVLQAFRQGPEANQPDGHTETMYQQASLLDGPSTTVFGASSLQAQVQAINSTITFLVGMTFIGFLVFGCIVVPLTWLLLYGRPVRHLASDDSAGESAR